MTLPKGLEYACDDGVSWRPVPKWASFYESIGRLASRGMVGSSRLVIGLSVPARYMAAPLTALGAVVGVVERELPGVTTEQRFAELAALPPDTVLRFISPNSDDVRLGVFKGIRRKDGVDYVMIKSGRTTYGEPARWALNIQRTDLTPDDVPKNGRVRRKTLSSHHFWRSILPDSDYAAFNRDARVECLLLGNGPSLSCEVHDQQFRVPKYPASYATGTLNSILRVHKYSGVTEPSWAEVGSTVGARRLPERLKTNPRVVIFDGSRGFLRWRKYFSDSAWIVVLDRNDSQYGDGTDEFNSDAALRSDQDRSVSVSEGLPPGVAIPPGVEVSAFLRIQTG